MSRQQSLAATVGIKRRGWAKRGLKARVLPQHAMLLAGYDVCTGIMTVPVGLYGAVSTHDGTHHATSALAHEWDLAKKAIAS